MRNWHAAAVLVIASLGVRSAAAQSAGATSSDPLGTGPRVDVQTSGNGTLDVGGARGTDLNFTGENFRGNFGASRPQPGATTNPNSAAGRLPTKSPTAPNFGPSLPGGSLPADSAGRYGDNLDATDLILPRFRRNLQGRDLHPIAAPAPTDSWRYRYFGGRWWYWRAGQDWVYWNGVQWLSYTGS